MKITTTGKPYDCHFKSIKTLFANSALTSTPNLIALANQPRIKYPSILGRTKWTSHNSKSLYLNTENGL